MDDNKQTPQKPSGGYGKKPLWFWIMIYVVVGAVVYGLIYWYVAMSGSNSGGNSLY